MTRNKGVPLGCALGNSLGTVFPGCTLDFSTVCPTLTPVEHRANIAHHKALKEIYLEKERKYAFSG